MPLSITPEGKPTQSNAWRERDLTWKESGPARDTWGVPGTALTKDVKTTLTLSAESKPTSNATWDEYTTSYDESDPDTWDSQVGSSLTLENKP